MYVFENIENERNVMSTNMKIRTIECVNLIFNWK